MSDSDNEKRHTFNGGDLEADNSSKNSANDSQGVYPITHPNNIPISGTLAHSTTKSLGIRKAEVLTDQYKSYTLRVILFVCVFLTSYAYAIESTVKYTMETYAAASFEQHAMKSTVGVVQAVAAAAAQPTYARLSDRFGRLQLYILALVFYVVGTIVQFTSKNIDALSAGTVIYQIGYQGIVVLLQIVLADFSNLNWRLAVSFIPALPFIINTWISGDLIAALYPAHSWQYGYGIWAFIFPLSCLPLLACFAHMRWLANSTPEWKLLKEEERSINKWTSFRKNIIIDVIWEVDAVAILFIICIFGFILVPFTLTGGASSARALGAAGYRESWARGGIIAPLIIGFVLIPGLVIWETKFAKFPLLPGRLMSDRGVWSALVVAVFINMLWTIPNEYLYTVLVVSMNTSIKAATRITSLYSFVSVIVGPLLGLLITRVRRLKGFIIFGVICWVASFAILYVKRGDPSNPEGEKHGIIGGLCLMGFGAGFFTYSTQVSIATCTNHEYMAVVISIYLASYNIGSAIGSAISGAVWANTFYNNISNEFERLQIQVPAITAYGDPLTFSMNHTWGTPERIAMTRAMSSSQRILCLVSLCLVFVLLIDVFFLRDHRLDSVQSLELDHSKEEGVKGTEGQVVLNNYDDDLIFKRIKGLFKKN